MSDPDADVATPDEEAFLSECINNVVWLLETVLQNADTCCIFVEKKGMEALLQLTASPIYLSHFMVHLWPIT
jgi:hypothetical protein